MLPRYSLYTYATRVQPVHPCYPGTAGVHSSVWNSHGSSLANFPSLQVQQEQATLNDLVSFISVHLRCACANTLILGDTSGVPDKTYIYSKINKLCKLFGFCYHWNIWFNILLIFAVIIIIRTSKKPYYGLLDVWILSLLAISNESQPRVEILELAREMIGSQSKWSG